jgi:hypothetical protein
VRVASCWGRYLRAVSLEGYEQRRAERLRRHAARRRRRAWGLTVLIAALAAALGLLASTQAGKPRAGHVESPPRGTAASTVTPPAPRRAGPGLGEQVREAANLPQTRALPSTHGAGFKARMAALWEGIRQGRSGPALPAFFPREAYVRLKAIYDAASDWQNRLVHDYDLDIRAAHRLLGPDARHARLLGVQARPAYAHWIEPGVCSNDVGYYEMPNARVLYSEGGRTRSLGIASMISWRGQWYVVHLGAVLREGDVGEVDEPSAGAGRQLYSGTC